MRIQLFLRDMGLGSRRKTDALVTEKKVSVNGKLLTDPTCLLKNGDVIDVKNMGSWTFEDKEQEKFYLIWVKAQQVEITEKNDEDE